MNLKCAKDRISESSEKIHGFKDRSQTEVFLQQPRSRHGSGKSGLLFRSPSKIEIIVC